MRLGAQDQLGCAQADETKASAVAVLKEVGGASKSEKSDWPSTSSKLAYQRETSNCQGDVKLVVGSGFSLAADANDSVVLSGVGRLDLRPFCGVWARVEKGSASFRQRLARFPLKRGGSSTACRVAGAAPLQSEAELTSIKVAGKPAPRIDRGIVARNAASSGTETLSFTRVDTLAAAEPIDSVVFSAGVPAFYAYTKRATDLLISGLLLLLLLPVGLLIGGLVRLSSRGPALYMHRRVGLHGKLFWCFKFRTMCDNAERMKIKMASQSIHSDQRTFKIPNDPRVTRLGCWMRRLSIDEFPQLINVLLGQMSLVGPRPPLPCEVEHYSIRDRLRLSVKPGLTCIWQVSGRSNLGFEQQIEMDLEYVRRQSLLLDTKLILQTVPAVLSADGAY